MDSKKTQGFCITTNERSARLPKRPLGCTYNSAGFFVICKSLNHCKSLLRTPQLDYLKQSAS